VNQKKARKRQEGAGTVEERKLVKLETLLNLCSNFDLKMVLLTEEDCAPRIEPLSNGYYMALCKDKYVHFIDHFRDAFIFAVDLTASYNKE
jgi:hypothetical protein